jgi:HD-like signal output (HDOD) protein
MLMTPAALLSHIHAVPAIPKVVQQLIETFDAPEVNVSRVSRLVNTDPMIAAKVLRLANSAYYRRARAVASIDDAVVFLGLDALRMLVVGAGFAGVLPVPTALGRALFWRYCLHTAVCAKFFAEGAGEDAQAAFTAGLLHAIGEPLMLMALEEPLKGIEANARFYDHERAACERACVGFSFSDLGAALADQWRFPPAIVEAIRAAPAPLEVEPFPKLAACVYLGAHFAAGLERHEHPDVSLSTLDLRVADGLGLDYGRIARMPPVAKLAEGLEELVA